MGKWDSKKKGWGGWREFHVWLNRISEGSSARHSGLKDPGLVQLWHRLQLPLGSDPRPGNSICHGVGVGGQKRKNNLQWPGRCGHPRAPLAVGEPHPDKQL